MFLAIAIGFSIAVLVFAALLLIAAFASTVRSARRRSVYFFIESDTQQQLRGDIVARLNKHAKIYQRSPADSASAAPLSRNAKIDTPSTRTSTLGT